MDKRIEELINKGFITRTLTVKDLEALETLSEKDLLEKGFITQTLIFDDDNTVDEIAMMEAVENEPKITESTPVVDDESKTTKTTKTTKSTPVVDDESKTTKTETTVEDEPETITVEEEDVEDDVKPVVDEGDEEE